MQRHAINTRLVRKLKHLFSSSKCLNFRVVITNIHVQGAPQLTFLQDLDLVVLEQQQQQLQVHLDLVVLEGLVRLPLRRLALVGLVQDLLLEGQGSSINHSGLQLSQVIVSIRKPVFEVSDQVPHKPGFTA